MIHHIHSLRIILALLVVVMATMIGAGFSISAQAAKNKIDPPRVNEHRRIGIRIEEERTLRFKDKSRSKYANTLAKQYLETAKIVQKQGGDPRPLRAAAAHFLKEAKAVK